MEGGLTGLGAAKIGAAGLQFARTEAIANARDEMARTLSIKVKNMFKNFTQVTGVGDAETVDKVSANVSKQVANQTLEGSRAKNVWLKRLKTSLMLKYKKSLANRAIVRGRQIYFAAFFCEGVRYEILGYCFDVYCWVCK
jgi:ABC-type sulfate transport system substrate-binding protein